MRIGLVIREFNPNRGGAEHWTWQFAGALVRHGHAVTVVAERFADETKRLGVTAHRLKRVSSAWNFAEQAEEAARGLPVDVVHDMGQGWYCDLFQPHGGSRTASFEHNLLLWPRVLRPAKRVLARCLPRYRELEEIARRQYDPQAVAGGRLFLALSNMVAGHMGRYHQIPPQSTRLVYNGVDVDRFSPQRCRPLRESTRRAIGIETHETALLIVAHNLRLKGVPTLLRALSRLRRAGKKPRLIVAGGKNSDGCQAQARRLNLGGQVLCVGAQQDVLPYYAAADLYVQPTFYDPCSLVVLEALACGLPVVTSRYNGAGELLEVNRHGVVIDDPADDRELAAALAPLLDRDRLAAMSPDARKLAEQHSFSRNVAEIVAIYEELAGRRRIAA